MRVLSDSVANALGSLVFLAIVSPYIVAVLLYPDTQPPAAWVEQLFEIATLVIALAVAAAALGLVFYRPWSPKVLLISAGLNVVWDGALFVIERKQGETLVLDSVVTGLSLLILVAALIALRSREIRTVRSVHRKLHWLALLIIFVGAGWRALSESREQALAVVAFFAPLVLVYWFFEGSWQLFVRPRKMRLRSNRDI